MKTIAEEWESYHDDVTCGLPKDIESMIKDAFYVAFVVCIKKFLEGLSESGDYIEDFHNIARSLKDQVRLHETDLEDYLAHPPERN